MCDCNMLLPAPYAPNSLCVCVRECESVCVCVVTSVKVLLSVWCSSAEAHYVILWKV